MKGRLLIVVLILSLAVNASAVATVGYHYWRNTCFTPSESCPLNQEDHHPYQDVCLSPEQLTQMESFSKSFHSRLRGLEELIAAKRNLLIDLLGEKEIDPSKIEVVRKEIAGYQDDIQKEVIAHIGETKKIMNPEQHKQFMELLRASSNRGQLNSSIPIIGGTH
jgi:Spy/CpxP family protein refolding chaperone